jgi:hypothetical protein
VLLSRIRERRSAATERVINGSFDKLEDYKYIVGKLKGLEEMESLTMELFKSLEGS